MKIHQFKGIAIFGAPGSGKTTMARAIIKGIPGSRYVEASRAVLFPAMSMDHLPKEENVFISDIVNFRKETGSFPRDDARNFFIRLGSIYSPVIMAKTLVQIHKNKFKNRLLIIAGTRGYKNAEYLRESGYLLVYLKTPGHHAVKRLSRRESLSRKKAELERRIEERIFSTGKIEKIAHLSFGSSGREMVRAIAVIKDVLKNKECGRCVNSGNNPSGIIGSSGLCNICERYKRNFKKGLLDREKIFLNSFRSKGSGKYDAMVGISGGKDSTATLYTIKQMGFRPLAFSLNTGYYPKHIFSRARTIAAALGVDYEEIDVRKYIRPVDRLSFKKTAELYGEKDSDALREKFRKWYAEGRKHYSIKCKHAIPFVRTCQLCRRIIVRAYYAEASKRNIPLVVLGINEWAGLSQDNRSEKFIFSAFRKLRPIKDKPPIYVVHLPFLLRRTIKDTVRILKKTGWKIPEGESLIESNANSCLFARAAEDKALRMLGFHPDATRLSREVTVGFITKQQARKALSGRHRYPYSVRRVLQDAGIL